MRYFNILILIFLCACQSSAPSDVVKPDISADPCAYVTMTGKADQSTGGIRMIPISTPIGDFKVWTKRIGNNPSKKVLLLHGGPGGTHEFFESFEGYFPQEGIEFYYYDQLGSYYSDQPSDTSLWTISRFVEEVEQVRKALNLGPDNFYLYGQSWGGILAMEYALKYQEHLKGLIISNMVMSIPEYNKYAKEVLGPAMDPAVHKELMAIEAKQDFDNPRYLELLFEHHYTQHIMRKPLAEWPESVNRAFKHLNPEVYIYMQGYSEFGVTGDATLIDWDVRSRLKEIKVPTLSIGASHDSMDPEHMRWLADQVQDGTFLLCPEGSHLSQYDDQSHFFPGLIDFIHKVDAKK